MEVGVEVGLTNHVPSVFRFPRDQEVGFVEFFGEELVHGFGFGEAGGVAEVGGAVGFDECEVGGELWWCLSDRECGDLCAIVLE